MIDRDRSKLFPAFATMLEQFDAALVKADLPFFLFEGYRDWTRQEELYAQGRTTPGAIVTKAAAGHSWHNFGFAADYVIDSDMGKPGMQWSWDMRGDRRWLKMAQTAVGVGLESAYFWPNFCELPHVQYTFGLTLDRARHLYLQSQCLEPVWDEAQQWLENNVWP